MLTPEQLKQREGKLTGSVISCLMTGDKERVLNLWKMLVGDPSYVEADLSAVWPVQLGSTTEALHLDWVARKHGTVSRRGEVVTHPDVPYFAATLDAWLDSKQCPVEVKHVSGHEKYETVKNRYLPQVTWQALCTNSNQTLFSVVEGAAEPYQQFIPLDSKYAKELWDRAEAFMACVRNLTPPVQMAPVVPPVSAFREYDWATKNSWVTMETQYLQNKAAAKLFDDAAKDLREQVPPDASKVIGRDLSAVRDRANRLRLVEK